MSNHWLRVVFCVMYCSASLTTACFAQKPTSKPDDWPMQNAMIGPDSPIEIRAGSSYQAQAMYPVPDGPLFPLKAGVTWSIEPAVKGISIDAAGKISVDAAVSHGATAIVHANVEGGRRKLAVKVYVFQTEDNPLIGAWRVDTRVVCGETQEMKDAAARPLSLRGNNWKFHVSQQFWVGKEHNIAAGVRLAGSYELDLKAAKIKLVPTWPKKPASNWAYLLKEDGKTLILQPLEPQDDLDPGCGYILLR
jgi:hypothetical protein